MAVINRLKIKILDKILRKFLGVSISDIPIKPELNLDIKRHYSIEEVRQSEAYKKSLEKVKNVKIVDGDKTYVSDMTFDDLERILEALTKDRTR